MAWNHLFFIYIIVALIELNHGGQGAPTRTKQVMKNHSIIIVDPAGKGNFTNIQSAIDSIPAPNNQWIYILIKKGIYREKIHIPFGKSYVYLEGEGKRETYVVWDDHGPIDTSATFTAQGDFLIVKHITFINSYNSHGSHNPMKPALAARIEGDKSAFFRCGFMGLQDTLWDVQGRHFFKLCSIQGAVDFIFGAGQSLYERCTISVIAGALNGTHGYITAQARSKPNEASGFTFKECNIIGNGKVFLGRAWRAYARVIFYNTSMSDVIVPQGWDPWSSTGHEYQLTFDEYDCHGLGSNTSSRVKWANKLDQGSLNKLISASFIDDDGWLTSLDFN